jgi:hypothetical protein
MRSKLLILSLLFCLSSFAQVPNTETFSLFNVANTVRPDAVAQVDQVTKSGYPANCTVTCNGGSHAMIWNTNAATTVANFVTSYSTSYPGVTLANSGGGVCTFTGNTPGVSFSPATIDGTGSTATTITQASYTMDLARCFEVGDKFDYLYYPQYHFIDGSNVSNSLLNFRNYGSTCRPPEGFGVNDQRYFQMEWTWFDNSWDEIGFEIYRSPDGVNDWELIKTTTPNAIRYIDGGLAPGTTYYYKIRTYAASCYSDFVTGYAATEEIPAGGWFLPSSSELFAMFTELFWYGVGDFQADWYYWSSTEASATTATCLKFHIGLYPSVQTKNTAYSVRPARKFNGSVGQYALRDTGPMGGLIFNITDNGGGSYTYYEAAPTDTNVDVVWSNKASAEIGLTSSNIGFGWQNTVMIVSQYEHTNSAAKACIEY